jgi:hypothetical protein
VTLHSATISETCRSSICREAPGEILAAAIAWVQRVRWPSINGTDAVRTAAP